MPQDKNGQKEKGAKKGDSSTNLSKIKREHLLEICSRIRNQEDVDITEIAELEHFIKSMKYGLVFEQHEEPVDVMLRTHILVFKEFKEIRNDPDSADCNFLLEGDNLHSLKLLEKTHKGKIDVIYIDPPYNTLNDDFAYGDKMLDEEDGFKHSKWLSFMKERLEIARKLLSDEGVIFISIDDNEQAQLKLLCDDIFGESNFVANLIWKTKNEAKGIPPKTMCITTHEYILVYSKNNNYKFIGHLRNVDDGFKNPDNDPRGPWKRQYLQRFGQGFPIRTIINPSNNMSFSFETPYTEEKINNWIKEGIIIFPDTSDKYPARKEYFTEYNNPYKPITTDLGLYSTKVNSEKIKALFSGKKMFDYTKPVELIMELLKVSTTKEKIILDFFAGSGTTGHAVMELNQEDGGNRSFILCTNNEVSAVKTLEYIQSKGYMKDVKSSGKNKTIQTKIDKFFEENPDVYQELMIVNKLEYETYGICQSVTYPRLNTVITGIRPDGTKYSDGIKTNLRYFQTDMVDKKDDDLDELLHEASFCLAELEHMAAIDGTSICVAECDEDVDDIIL